MPSELLPKVARWSMARPTATTGCTRSSSTATVCSPSSRPAGRRRSRARHDWTDRFPTIAGAVAELPAPEAWLDGEVVALGPDGVSSFGALQQALSAGGRLAAGLLRVRPALPRRVRPARLPAGAAQGGPRGAGRRRRAGGGSCRTATTWSARGTTLEQACSVKLEGVIYKRGDRPYRRGHARLAEGEVSSPAGVRRRRLHRTGGRERLSARCSSATTTATGLAYRRSRRHRVRRRRWRRCCAACGRCTAEPAFADPPAGRRRAVCTGCRPSSSPRSEFADWTATGTCGTRRFKRCATIRRRGTMVREAPADEGGAPPGDPRPEAEVAQPTTSRSRPRAPRSRAGSRRRRRRAHRRRREDHAPRQAVLSESGHHRSSRSRATTRVSPTRSCPTSPAGRSRWCAAPKAAREQCFFQKHADA